MSVPPTDDELDQRVKALLDQTLLSPKGYLACPFCGGTQLTRFTALTKPDHAFVKCDRCGATGPIERGETGTSWNMRAFEGRLYVPINSQPDIPL